MRISKEETQARYTSAFLKAENENGDLLESPFFVVSIYKFESSLFSSQHFSHIPAIFTLAEKPSFSLPAKVSKLRTENRPNPMYTVFKEGGKQVKYERIVEDSVLYIKEHIQEDLTAQKIADQVGYSVFHFCRIFSLIKNLTPMEYVRRYRLAAARSELESNKKIIDIALQYGFETASGFTKSFRREFGYTPTSYIVRMHHTDSRFIQNVGEVLSAPKIVKRESFKVAGYGIYTNVAEQYEEDISAYWASYEGNSLEDRMYEQLQPPQHGEIGICLPYQDNEKAVYLFGVIVENFDKVTSDMIAVEIPAATYAVFTTPPVNNLNTAETYDKDPLAIAVKETWRYIFAEWFSGCPYILDETRHAFEFYDERCHASEAAVMEIYVPIQTKGPGNTL